jgi:hypothetical protein
MWEDPIVEEVRRARDEYARGFGYDLDAIFRDLQNQEETAREQGWQIVSMPPRKPDVPPEGAT